MILELLIALLCGVTAGTITGLTPGIHINLVAAILLSLALSQYFSLLTPIFVMIFIASMSITHIFIDFIPSIYLGAPDDNSCLSVMPGHELLLDGKGHEAVFYTLIGCLSAVLISILITPILTISLPLVYPFLQRLMALILIWAVIFLIYREPNSKIWALIIFFLSGFLGIATLNLPLKEPLLPLLSGLFGCSTLIYSISQKTKIPPQKLEKIEINKKELLKPLLSSSIISPLCSFLPGLGSSQAAIIGSEILGKLNRKQFLFLLGSASIITMSLSFTTLYIINKSRTGSAALISQIITLTPFNLFLIFLSIIISAIISFFITIYISKHLSSKISQINYSLVSKTILLIITICVIVFSGLLGLLILIISTIVGLLAITVSIRRGHLMGCLVLPTILFYLPL